MTILEFPPIESADDDGLLAVGGDLEVESLLLAYRCGIFPWPFDERLLAWFAPPMRAILFFENFHMSRTLKKAQRSTSYTYTIDQAFDEVIEGCSDFKGRKHEKGTWITSSMKDAYKRLHRAGFAHSYECWEGSDLVGGLYGVSIGKAFAGESMFHRKPNTSKLTLAFAIERLKEKGVSWMDCQVINRNTKALGAVEVERGEYMSMLQTALKSP